ncbi:MAG: hypothetical protein ABH969_09775 [Pseudomonadota bacterium]
MALLLHQQFKGKGLLLTQSQRKLLEYILGHEDEAVVTALGVQDKKTPLTSLKALEEVWKNQAIYYNTGKRGKGLRD